MTNHKNKYRQTPEERAEKLAAQRLAVTHAVNNGHDLKNDAARFLLDDLGRLTRAIKQVYELTEGEGPLDKQQVRRIIETNVIGV